MNFNLPKSAFVNKFIAKTKFYDKVHLSTRLQNEFIRIIQRITWQYKLAEETIGISKTENVTEIQVFEIELKKQKIPLNALKIIDKTIPYQILYVLVYKENIAYGISLKENNQVKNYYFSGWNEETDFDFTGITLEKVYQKLIKCFIASEAREKEDFEEIIKTHNAIRTLEKDILSLESKIKREKQFNRKVELNKTLLEKKRQLKSIYDQF